MEIYHDLQNFSLEKPVITIGTFDGVHLGHQKVISRIKQIAEEQGGQSVVFSFHPHPRMVLAPEGKQQTVHMLTTIDERIELFRSLGVEHLIIYPFTKSFSKLPYGEFVENVLHKQLKVHTLALGYDHKFGKNREGSYDTVAEMARNLGFRLEKLEALLVDDINISSTKIRKHLLEGSLARAASYLGYRYQLNGVVVEGKKIGRTIQFPTANIRLTDSCKLIPRDGVYAVRARVMGKLYEAMMNIGVRPTVNEGVESKTMEVHIFNFGLNIYGREIKVEFIDRIRDEQKFHSVDALRQQLEQDKKHALEIHKLANT